MILTKLRLAIGAAALAAAGVWLWNLHDALAERRVATAVHRLHVQRQRQEAERLRIARKHHADVALLMKRNRELKRRIDVENDARCAWSAHTVRLLNTARGHEPDAARQPDGSLPALARAERARGPAPSDRRRD